MRITCRNGSTGSSLANYLVVYPGLRHQELHGGINIFRDALEITTRAFALAEPTQVQGECAEASRPNAVESCESLACA